MLSQREKQAYLSFLDESGLNELDDDDHPGIMEGIKDFLRGFAPKEEPKAAESM